MSLTINTNINSLVAQNNLSTNQASLATSMQRLSSGLRINSAKDDAAGLSIAERMTAQINGSNQAARNANDGISLAQTAEGAMSQISSNLQRMRELAVQSANGTNTSSDRAALNNEVQALSQEIDRVAQSANFNGVNLLDGSFTAQKFQVGANGTANDSITVSQIASARTSALGGSGASTSTTVTGVLGSVTPLVALNAGDLTLNGLQVGASIQGAAPGQDPSSAYSIAAAINAVSAQSGVTATANVTKSAAITVGGFASVLANVGTVNGVNVGAIAAGTDAIGSGANVAAAFNLVSAQSGVTASSDATSGAVTFTAADGRNINIAGFGSAGTTIANQTITGGIVLNSNAAGGITASGNAPLSAGIAATHTPPTTTLTINSISSIDVLTASNATNALAAIDGALSTINASRATLGAAQNRFTSVVSSLQTTSQNLTASRSRIQDADFASETSNLSRAQILQQAGTAMVAQANSLPQGVLALLK